MGLDIVELVLRCEEAFAIELPNWKCERVHTVGDLYTIVCEGLALTPVANPTPETGIDRLPRGILNLTTVIWTPEDVWATLAAIFVDQLAVRKSEVIPGADIQRDLRCD